MLKTIVGTERGVEPVELAFDELGDSDNKPLIILHGFFASSRNWRSIAKALSTEYHVYVPDLRNHGSSPHSKKMDYPAMVADLQYFLEQHHLLSTVSLLGHSMGGKVAMWFALNNPHKVDKLIVADISPTRYSHSFHQTIQALRDLPLDRIKSRKQAEEFLADRITDKSYRQFLLQNLQLDKGQYHWRVDLDIFEHAADHIISFPDSEGYEAYSGAALFLGGGDSEFIRENDVYRLFPNAIISYIPDTAHWLHVQAPEKFYQAVSDFLA